MRYFASCAFGKPQKKVIFLIMPVPLRLYNPPPPSILMVVGFFQQIIKKNLRLLFAIHNKLGRIKGRVKKLRLNPEPLSRFFLL